MTARPGRAASEDPANNRGYALPAHVRWVQDADRVIVVDEQRHAGYELRGVEAAIWSWLTLSYARTDLVRLSAHLLGLPEPADANHLDAILTGWETRGLLAAQLEPADD